MIVAGAAWLMRRFFIGVLPVPSRPFGRPGGAVWCGGHFG
jgi:hypothetical protein